MGRNQNLVDVWPKEPQYKNLDTGVTVSQVIVEKSKLEEKKT
jgi:hypothetical protein